MSGEGDFVYIEVQDLDLLDEDPEVSVDRDAGDMDKSRGESVNRNNHTQNKDSKSHSWKQNSLSTPVCMFDKCLYVRHSLVYVFNKQVMCVLNRCIIWVCNMSV